jgi:hypothetical protein
LGASTGKPEVFFSANSISADFAMLKLFTGTYEISELSIDHPRSIIIQEKKTFNFDDLMLLFSSDSTAEKKEPVHFNILRITIKDGEFYYREKQIPINYFLKNVNIESDGKCWDADTMAFNFAFQPGNGGGGVAGNMTINFETMDYNCAIFAHQFDLQIIEQYLKEMSNGASFSATLDANIKATGSFKDAENISATGKLSINDFHFGKNPQNDYASFDKLRLDIIALSPKNNIYFFDTILLSHPYFMFERYDYLDNIQTMFGEDGANIKSSNEDPEKFNLVIMIASYVKLLSKNFFQSDYKIKRLSVTQGDIKFNDYSISEKFSVDLCPLTISADSIDRNHKQVNMFFSSGILPYGNAQIYLCINPKDSSDFDITYHLEKLPVAMFNPYTITYTSYPSDRGTMELKGIWNVRNGVVQSKNHLIIIDPRMNKRIRNKDTQWVPAPLILLFVRERGNVIDYEIPITGDLKNPKFHFWDVISDLLANIFIKPATTPYRMEVKNTETAIEKSLHITWGLHKSTLSPQQEKFIEEMAEFLKENPDAVITVQPNQYSVKEKEYALFYEAKKKYYLFINKQEAKSFNESDSKKVDKMSVKDSLFVLYLDKQINGAGIPTIQEKCARLIGSPRLNTKLSQLYKERQKVFLSIFEEYGVEKQVQFQKGKTTIPYNGFSFYKIDYNGDLPASLMEAFQKMEALNESTLRKKYAEERKSAQKK